MKLGTVLAILVYATAAKIAAIMIWRARRAGHTPLAESLVLMAATPLLLAAAALRLPQVVETALTAGGGLAIFVAVNRLTARRSWGRSVALGLAATAIALLAAEVVGALLA